MKPKLLFCSQTAYTGGGMETWMELLTSQLEQKGWDVTVALAQGRKFHNPDEYLRKHNHSKTLFLDGTLGYRECRVDTLLKTFRTLEPDLVIPVGLADALYATAWWKQKGGKTKLVTCLHSQDRRVLHDLEICSSWVDMAVSVSRKGLSLLQEVFSGLECLVTHIPTGVSAPVAPKERVFDKPVLELAYIGRMDNREKRVLDIVQLVEKLAGAAVRIHLIGAGPDGKILQEMLTRRIHSGEVVFHGQVDRDTLYKKIYPEMDGLLLFSPAEGGPIVAWEAMIHGVVPVVSDFKGRREEGVIRDGKNALVFPVGDTVAAVHCIKILQNSSKRKFLSENAGKLPDLYKEADFVQNWDENLRKCLTAESRNMGKHDLPCMVSSGRLARFSGYRCSLLVRKFQKKKFVHTDAGGEWPSVYQG